MTDESDQPDGNAERIARWDAEVCNHLMGTPQGRFLMERFLDFCCEGRDLYLNDGDALGMAMRDGMARAGRWWRVMLEAHCPDLYMRMIRERRGRAARAEQLLKAKEAEAQADGLTPSGTPIEAMADEQERQAAEEAARQAKAARQQRKPKKDR
jgi:hypothetical protein